MPASSIAAASLALFLAFAAPAGAQERTIVAAGAGQVAVTPTDRTSNDAIATAVEQAYQAALPKALADAREDAHALATAAGLTLGALLSASDAPNSPYYGPFGGPGFGTFGPGKFCGTIRRAIIKRTKTGRPKVVGHRTRHTCRVPPFQIRQVTLTFASQ